MSDSFFILIYLNLEFKTGKENDYAIGFEAFSRISSVRSKLINFPSITDHTEHSCAGPLGLAQQHSHSNFFSTKEFSSPPPTHDFHQLYCNILKQFAFFSQIISLKIHTENHAPEKTTLKEFNTSPSISKVDC